MLCGYGHERLERNNVNRSYLRLYYTSCIDDESFLSTRHEERNVSEALVLLAWHASQCGLAALSFEVTGCRPHYNAAAARGSDGGRPDASDNGSWDCAAALAARWLCLLGLQRDDSHFSGGVTRRDAQCKDL